MAFIMIQVAGNKYFAIYFVVNHNDMGADSLRDTMGWCKLFCLVMCSPFQKLELKCTNEKNSGFTFSSYELVIGISLMHPISG